MNEQPNQSIQNGDQTTVHEGETGQEIKEINSLVEYLDWIKEVCPDGPAHEYTLFYRGHSDFNYKLEPSAYRFDNKGKTFRPVEHHLYSEMLRHSPSDFAEDKNIFERLVRMQHYGLPTRLLDLTLNPLIALYFSCCEKNDVAGEVIIFPRKNNEFCYSSGILESAFVGIEEPVDISHISSQILSHLIDYFSDKNKILFIGNNFNQELVESFENQINSFKEFYGNLNDALLIASLISRFNNEIELIFEEKIDNLKRIRGNLDLPIEDRLSASDKQLNILNFKSNYFDFVKKLIKIISDSLKIKNINTRINSLDEFILQFTHYIFVLPLINNERIRRQQGAFLLFPPEMSSYWSVESIASNPRKVRVNASMKIKIIKELSVLGISDSYIFPELATLAKDVKLRHPAR